jgi:hypothetical protein
VGEKYAFWRGAWRLPLSSRPMLRRSGLGFAFLVLALGSACGRENGNAPSAPSAPKEPQPPPPTATEAPPTAASTPAPVADGATGGTDRCADIRARFNAELAKKSDACTTAADCACYGAEGGGCGGVTDSATARRLAPISEEFHKENCRYTALCAAWSCAPKCVNGLCRR